MEFVCNGCGKRYRVPDSRLKKAVTKATCTRCGTRILIHRPTGSQEPPPLPDSPEQIAQGAPSTPLRVPSPKPTPRPTPASTQRPARAPRRPSPAPAPPAPASWEGTVQVPSMELRPAYGGAPVTVSSFRIALRPVTNAEYHAFVRDTDALPPASWGRIEPPQHMLELPVVGVSLGDAREYAAWKRMRLPTSLEWEAAARAPDGRAFPWGDEWDPARCVSREGGAPGPAAVGSLPAGRSALGIVDLVGNVWEWTEVDPRGPRPEEGSSWVFGGSYRHRCAVDGHIARTSVLSTNSYDYLGFRCVVDD